ncbi:DUF4352 domain-containing protein [Gracilibacillus alcaliphilus]|uniref:DUF4352 domain-containing protein n=1 Tax=Gracilibacillus alcaliphilus TaxID=1401441 RepID=UPI00195E4766|nr:hypothetical protein [Gracilibacillus alcaliphilus]
MNEIIFRITWLGLLLFVFLACSSNDQAENNENETSDSPELEDTTENVDGICLEYRGYEPDEGGQFLVANITMGNIGDRSVTPQEQLYNEDYSMLSSLDEIFTERNDVLEPGEAITGNLVYNHGFFEDHNVYYLTFEAEATKEETRFEI